MKPNGSAPDLSIILVTWNQLALTAGALESIREKVEGITYETFVVDNGSKDETGTVLPQRFPWVQLIRNPDNRGFTRANNQAIRRARGRYILLLNNDTIQIENALGKAVAYMDQHRELGALGITHLNNDAEHTFQPSFFPFPNPWPEIRSLVSLTPVDPSPSEAWPAEQDVDWVVGSFLMMRRECYEEVGELDERFFIYDEDVDWCLRAHKAGWRVRYWPGARMIHLGAASRPMMKDKTFVHFRSHLSYFHKNHSLSAASAYYTTMGLRVSLATAKQLVRYVSGQAPRAALDERWNRQRQFLMLRAGRTGG